MHGSHLSAGSPNGGPSNAAPPRPLRGPAWPKRGAWALQRAALSAAGRVGLWLRGRLFALARAVGPAELSLYEDAFAHLTSQSLAALVQSGALAALHAHGPATAEQLGARCGAQADILGRLLRFGVTRGWLSQRRGGKFALARGARPLLPDAARPMAPFVSYATGPTSVRAVQELGRVLQEGGSGFVHAHGTSVWSYFAEHAEEGRTFDLAMRSHSARDVHHVARAIAHPRLRHVCDLGGGIGTLLACVLQHHPHARGTLLDRAGTLAEAGPYLEGLQLADRVQLLPGDFFAPIEVTADVFTLRNILHDWPDADVARILRRVRDAMGPESLLYIVETLQRPAADAVVALSDVAMMLLTDSGRQRSTEEFAALARGAGLRVCAKLPSPQPMSLLVLRRAI